MILTEEEIATEETVIGAEMMVTGMTIEVNVETTVKGNTEGETMVNNEEITEITDNKDMRGNTTDNPNNLLNRILQKMETNIDLLSKSFLLSIF